MPLSRFVNPHGDWGPSRRGFVASAGLGVVLGLAGCGRSKRDTPKKTLAMLDDDPRAIAADAWIYAYPMLMNYKTLTKQVRDPGAPEHVGLGVFRHYAQFFTPANRDVVTPNNDTPYSWAWLDLRAEPWVLSVPTAPKDRYYVHQWMDLFTQIFGYVGVRATGYAAGHYLIAGPRWTGATPPGISRVLQAESDIVLDLGRTALHGPGDVPALKAFQAQYRLRPLSAFAGTSPPGPVPSIDFPAWDEAKALGPDFIGYLNFLLQFCQPPDVSERDLMARFAKIGISPGAPFDLAALPAQTRQAVIDGAADGATALKAKVAATKSSIGLFGSRQQLGGDYMVRAAAAAMGLYGNAVEEAVYVGSDVDANGQALDGANRYEISLSKTHLPPASIFWSATMYGLPDRGLVENPAKRYSLGSRTPDLAHGADGSLTLYVQRGSPGPGKASNWLPTPASGPFTVIFRLYGPSPEAQRGEWTAPPIRKVA